MTANTYNQVIDVIFQKGKEASIIQKDFESPHSKLDRRYDKTFNSLVIGGLASGAFNSVIVGVVFGVANLIYCLKSDKEYRKQRAENFKKTIKQMTEPEALSEIEQNILDSTVSAIKNKYNV